MNRTIPIILVMFLSAGRFMAQQSDEVREKQWSLDACIRYAVENSHRLHKQEAQNTIYHQDYVNAIGKLIPTLNAGTNSYFNFGRGVDSETNLYTNINSFSNAYSIFTNLTIFNGLSNVYRIKMQKANTLMGKEQMEQEREMVAYDTMEAFINVLYYKRMTELAEEQVKESSNNLLQARRMAELGMKAKPDVAEMAAKEAADIYNLTRQKNLQRIGIILLKERMNFPVDEELDIMDEYEQMLVVQSEGVVPEIFETAKSSNPKAQVAALTLKMQEMNRRAMFGGFFPVISMEAGVSTGFVRYLNGSTYEPFSDQLKNKRGSYIGFTLSVPLFNGFSKSTTYKKSKAQVDIARSEYNESLRSLYSEVEQAVADMNGQAAAYQQAVRQREAMEIAHEINQRKQQEGLISPLELHTSANRVVQAKAEELNASLQYRLKARLVNYYKGESFIK